MNVLVPALLLVLAFAVVPVAAADGPLDLQACLEVALLPPPPQVSFNPDCAVGHLLPP